MPGLLLSYREPLTRPRLALAVGREPSLVPLLTGLVAPASPVTPEPQCFVGKQQAYPGPGAMKRVDTAPEPGTPP